MKLYEAYRYHTANIVWVREDERRWPLDPRPSQALRNHSPDGFDWGYRGSGPAQLALAILFDCLKDRHLAMSLYQDFKDAVIARAGKGGFGMGEEFIRRWVSSHPRLAEFESWRDA